MNKSNDMHASGRTVMKIGNYTKAAIENFESNIVNQTNYLEKVDANLKKDKK